jgi:hypothetical protein
LKNFIRLYTTPTLKIIVIAIFYKTSFREFPGQSDFYVSIPMIRSVTKPLLALENPTHLYSNPYSNADEKQYILAIRSEHQDKEISTRRASANTSKPSQAFPVCATTRLFHNVSSLFRRSLRRSLLKALPPKCSNRVATGFSALSWGHLVATLPIDFIVVSGASIP